MKIIDLAKAIAPDCEREYIGIRPGEKLHEILITEEDGRNTIAYNGMYVILPTYTWWKRSNYKTGQKLPEGFTYTSDQNDEWMSSEDLEKIIFGNEINAKDSGTMFAAAIHQLNEKAILNLLNAEENIPEISNQTTA